MQVNNFNILANNDQGWHLESKPKHIFAISHI